MGDSTAFFNHIQDIQPYLRLNLSEADTRVRLVDPVLRILGYEAVEDIRREVPVPATREFLDYELYADGKAQAIVEAKALRSPLTDQAAAQCVQYASILGVRWCVITNGVAWAVYNAHAKGPLPDKRVASIRLDGDEASLDEAWSVLSLLSRESLMAASPLTLLLTERVVVDELSRPNSAAVTALRRSVHQRFGERVTAQAVVDVIARLRLRARPPAEAETLAAPTPEPTEVEPQPRRRASRWRSVEETVSEVSPTSGRGRRRGSTKHDAKRITIGDLVAAELLPPDAVLDGRLRGVTFAARIRDGALEVNGRIHRNPSAAAKAVQGRTANGWVFWKYQGRPLLEYRAQFALGSQSKASS
jgi:hypothetical protein